MRIVREMEKKVKKNWMNIVPQIINNLNHTNDIICPNFGKKKIDYMYLRFAEFHELQIMYPELYL